MEGVKGVAFVAGGGREALDLSRRRCRSLEPWFSSPPSGVVVFLPVERTRVGQGYSPNDAVQTDAIDLPGPTRLVVLRPEKIRDPLHPNEASQWRKVGGTLLPAPDRSFP